MIMMKWNENWSDFSVHVVKIESELIRVWGVGS